MGTVKKIGKEYYIEFEARGLKYQQKAGTDREAALRLLAEVEGKIAQGQMGILVRDVDVDIFFNDFKEFARQQHTRRTLGRFEALIDHFNRYLKNECPTVGKLSRVTPALLEKYKIYMQKEVVRKNPAKVINLTFFLLFELFQYAIKLGYLNDNPTLHVGLLKIAAGRRPRGLTDGQIQTLKEKSTPFFAAAIDLILLTGMRWRELARLKWEDVDNKKGVVKVEGQGIISREIPLTARLKEVLDSLEKSRPVDAAAIFTDPSGRRPEPQSLYLQFHQLLYNCGLANQVTGDCLRHTFAKALLNRGISLGALYRYLGLSDIARAMIYAAFIPQKRKELYEGLT